MPWFVWLIIAVALDVVAYLIAPKPKAETPTVQQITAPVVEAGIPIPVVWGSMTIQSPNILWYGETGGVVANVNA